MRSWKSSACTSSGCARRNAPGTATDRPWPSSSSTPTSSRCTAQGASRPTSPAGWLPTDLSIAFPTAGELWKWALTRRWGGVRRGALELFLDQALILPAGRKAATVWGELAAEAQRRGRPRPLNDTWIAACCIQAGLPLLTLNRRDFADFAEHEGLVLLGG
ncbi:MAG TPA: PIN domain-containing protein [Actinomycetota bacterium]|nr:PIN domain-containing protein [Actinomycetota bacterium]